MVLHATSSSIKSLQRALQPACQHVGKKSSRSVLSSQSRASDGEECMVGLGACLKDQWVLVRALRESEIFRGPGCEKELRLCATVHANVGLELGRELPELTSAEPSTARCARAGQGSTWLRARCPA